MAADETPEQQAQRLNLMGERLRKAGRFDEAKPYYLAALQAAEPLGPGHIQTAIILDNLGTLHVEVGQTSIGISLHYQAFSLLEQHPDQRLDIAITANNLGSAYIDLDDPSDARRYLEYARQIHESLGRSTSHYVGTLNNLARVMVLRHDYPAARALAEEALAVCDQLDALGGDGNRWRPTVVSSLGSILMSLGETAAAAPPIAAALEYFRERLGPRHSETLFAGAAQAELFHRTGDPRAEASLLSVLDGLSANERASWLVTERVRSLLADIYQSWGRVDQEADLRIANMESESLRTSELLHHAAGRVRIQAVTDNQQRFMGYMGFLDRVSRSHPGFVQAALDQWLRRKAMMADVLHGLRTGEKAPVPPRLTELRRQLAEDIRVSSARFVRPNDEWRARRARIDAARAEIEELERSLGARIRVGDTALLGRDVADRLADLLPAGTVLLEFCSLVPHQNPARDDGMTCKYGYGVFVVAGQDVEPARFRYLASGPDIDRLVEDALREIGAGGASRGISPRPDDAPEDDFSAEVYERLLALSAMLHDLIPADVTEVIVSADGDLGALPFQILPAEAGQRWIERYQIRYVASGRDLDPAPAATAAASPAGAPVVVAAPQFSTSGRTEPYAELDGARQEGIDIARILGTQALLGLQAAKNAVVTASRPSALHLATHGFFVIDQGFETILTQQVGELFESADPQLAAAVREAAKNLGGQRVVIGELSPSGPLEVDKQFLMGGLAFARANDAYAERREPSALEGPDKDYGELLSADITELDLASTELVVLSACDTGRGAMVPGQGLWGLPLALQVAGARSIAISLWRVDDDSTHFLMTRFYGLLRTGCSKAAALRQASLELRRIKPHPRYWAPFIVIGDDSPLSEMLFSSTRD